MLSERVSGLSPSIIREMAAKKTATSIDLSLGQPTLPPDPDLMARAQRRFESGGYGYTFNAGLPEARELVARHHSIPAFGSIDNVILTVGSEQAVFLAMMSLLGPGDEVLVPEPGYPAYSGIAKVIGAIPVPFPITRETGLVHRAEAIRARMTSKTKVVVINTPSNPFGRTDSEAELRAIAALAESHELTILADEIYRDLYYGEPPISISTMTTRVVLVSGLSKSGAMTGLRLGYLIGEQGFVKQATLAHQLMVTCAPRLAQYAAIEAFSNPSVLRAHIPHYEAARAAIVESASALPSSAPLLIGDAAFYAIVDVSAFAHGDPLALALRLVEEEDVIAVPGVAFGPSGDWFFRLSYASGAEACREGITRLGRFLHRLEG